MYKVKVFGAGSIGNHLSHASRKLGWQVDICDIDLSALKRTKNDIYPARYGSWDDTINLYHIDDVPMEGYDLIFVGTPPDTHIPLTLSAIKEKPKAILVEKPFCTPDLTGAQHVFEEAVKNNIPIFTGYDHVVGKAAILLQEMCAKKNNKNVETLDVEFREHWGGIFAAHPWLNGPADTYLGYWTRGGGASGEHSHAVNLWQHIAHLLGMGRVNEVAASMKFYRHEKVSYDKLCYLNLSTEGGLVGRVVQDVVTAPPKKWARIQYNDGYIEWHCGYQKNTDMVAVGGSDDKRETFTTTKTRPDDFIQELTHIDKVIKSEVLSSPISLLRGLDTMLVIAAAHKSVQEKRVIKIDYTKGYTLDALE